MSIYVIRHGQTGLNTQRRFNGSVDEDLSEEGISQAKEAGKKLVGKRFSAVFCSPLKRTRQTLENLKIKSSIPVYYDERLVERREGALAGMQIDDDFLQNVYLNLYAPSCCEGCETVPETLDRVYSLLDEVKARYKDEDVLLVTHGFIGRAIYYYFMGLPESGLLGEVPEAFLQNCQIRKFDFDGKTYENVERNLE